ncbi:unnamed protein product [Auanema sp. JU1783]|nr:unnamed protein product [Auanema sp. JU1783]
MLKSSNVTEEVKHPRFASDSNTRRIERNRVLTMKYGKQQMMVIRKRMQAENWIEEQICKLFNGKDDNGVEIDLDTLLDMPSIHDKRKFVFEQLQRQYCPASMDKITVFLDELMEQIKLL